MLDYEWGANPSPMILSADDQPPDSDHTHPIIVDHYAAAAAAAAGGHHSFSAGHILQGPTAFSPLFSPHHHQQPQHHQQNPNAVHSFYQYPHPGNFNVDSFSGGSGDGFLMPVPKSEELVVRPPAVDFTARIGLNLGGRTYFSSAEDDFVSRLYRRSRPLEPASVVKAPRCQAEGCNADLSHAKHYHRRHKVCEFHSKASAVIAAGLTQRFCQQCSRFHLLSEFDNGKRSCRKRLADHNRRRRKSQLPNPETQKTQAHGGRSSSIDSLAKSPQDSGNQSSSSVTIAMSPPRMSLDCFRQRPYHQSASALSSSVSSCSLFFSTG